MQAYLAEDIRAEKMTAPARNHRIPSNLPQMNTAMKVRARAALKAVTNEFRSQYAQMRRKEKM